MKVVDFRHFVYKFTKDINKPNILDYFIILEYH